MGNMVIPILMQFCNFISIWSVASRTSSNKCDIINDIKFFPTVYRRIYCHKFFMLSNQTPRYKNKSINMVSFLVKINFVCDQQRFWKGLANEQACPIALTATWCKKHQNITWFENIKLTLCILETPKWVLPYYKHRSKFKISQILNFRNSNF